MQILQVSNYVSHHQIPLARELARLVGPANFRFCATEAVSDERLKLGWSKSFDEPWILRAGETVADQDAFEQWWDKADVVLCGERLIDRFHRRTSLGKLSFYTSERWWKPPIGAARLLSPRFLSMSLRFRKLARLNSFHYLPIGPFAENDISLVAEMPERKWKWGYFTSVEHGALERPVVGKSPLNVLWAGRMLDWKLVDTVVRAAAAATRSGTSIFLTLIGDGPRRKALEQLAARLLTPDQYRFIDPLKTPEVLKMMANNDVFVLSSSAYEGWGAVINEAMASRCAVIASDQAGAARAMIDPGVNGLLFKPNRHDLLARLLCLMHDNAPLRSQLAAAAYETVSKVWSPQTGASRFVECSGALLSGNTAPHYVHGPMSRADFRPRAA
jgi:glycosyltransferase involved in cell wall biosynthesis